MTDDGLHQSTSVYASPVLPGGLMPLQADVTVPQSTTLSTSTGMLVTDTTVTEQLANFPGEIYDLTPTSHLMRLMQVLLGDSGTGQLRKRLLQAQVSALSTTGAKFFDLDRFYGPLFGAERTDDEQLPINPMDTAVATPAEWDEIEAADGSFRDRMTALAMAIAMGGTVPGLQAAASAVTGVDCDVYESWSMIESAADPGEAGHTWAEMEGVTWDDYEGETWGAIEGIPFYGRSGTLTRSEALIRINKDYDSSPRGRAERASDEWALVRVLGRLKPASLLITIDSEGSSSLSPRPISAATSDSTHWEIATFVTPQQTTGTNPYPLSYGQQAAGVSATDRRVLPIPPMTTRLGDSWSYGTQVPSCRSYAVQPVNPADFTQPGAVSDAAAVTDDQTVVWRDGTSTTYSAARGILDPLTAAAARAGSEGVLTAHPYSGDRRTVTPTD